MGFVDTDTHILENDSTWEYFDPSERHFRPRTAQFLDNQQNPTSHQLWVVGDQVSRRHLPNGLSAGFGKEYGPGIAGLDDPSARLAEMDSLGIDVQVLITSIFLGVTVDHPLREAAITRSYNRWMAERTADTGGRLPWLLVPPTRNMERAIEELEFGKAHGAVGVSLKGQEHGLFLDDPFFYPMYEKAQDLDLVISVHMGADVAHLPGRQIDHLINSPAALMDHLSASMKGMAAVVASDFDTRFPRLRFAFQEAGATWVPAIFQQQQRLTSTARPDGYVMKDGRVSVTIDMLDSAHLMPAKNIFVSCEADEDLPYLTRVLGPGTLMFGTDYCHNDIGADPLGHSTILSRQDISPEVARRIVDTNARTCFNLPSDLTPSDDARHLEAVHA